MSHFFHLMPGVARGDADWQADLDDVERRVLERWPDAAFSHRPGDPVPIEWFIKEGDGSIICDVDTAGSILSVTGGGAELSARIFAWWRTIVPTRVGLLAVRDSLDPNTAMLVEPGCTADVIEAWMDQR